MVAPDLEDRFSIMNPSANRDTMSPDDPYEIFKLSIIKKILQFLFSIQMSMSFCIPGLLILRHEFGCLME